MVNETLLSLAFEAQIKSYLLTQRQRELGRRLALGPVVCVQYNYSWEGEQKLSDNFFVRKTAPENVTTIIKDYGPADQHQIFVVADRPGLVASYMALGFSFLAPPHYLMAHTLDELPDNPSSHSVYQAAKASDALLLNTIDGADLIMAADVADVTFQHYYVLDGQQPVAMARNIQIGPVISWVSHVYTAPNQRRRGIATALMNKLMKERKDAGDRWSLLLATERAHAMYQQLGYEDLAPVINFTISQI